MNHREKETDNTAVTKRDEQRGRYWIALLLLLIAAAGIYFLPSFVFVFAPRISLNNIAFSPDGKMLAVEYPLKMWDLEKDRAIETGQSFGYSDRDYRVIYSPDNVHLAVFKNEYDHKIQIQNKNTLKTVIEFEGENGIFLNDGGEFAFARRKDDEYHIEVYNFKTKKQRTERIIYRPYESPLPDICLDSSISDDGTQRISAVFRYRWGDTNPLLGSDSIVGWRALAKKITSHNNLVTNRVWEGLDEETREILENWGDEDYLKNDKKFKVLKALNRIITEENLSLKKNDSSHSDRDKANRSILFNEFKGIITDQSKTMVMIWDLNGRKLDHKYIIDTNAVKYINSYKDKTWVYSGPLVVEIDVSRNSFGYKERDWGKYAGNVAGLSGNGKLIAVTRDSSVVEVRNLETGSRIAEINLPDRMSDLKAMEFSPDNTLIAVGTSSRKEDRRYYQGEIHLYDVKTGKLKKILKPGKVLPPEGIPISR